MTVTAQVEPLADRLDELKGFFPRHWAELGLMRDRMPLDPNYDEYLRRDALGQVLLVTARENGKLIGYHVWFVAPGLHYKSTLTATPDVFWVDPSRRGLMAGRRIKVIAEAEMRRRGVKMWWVGSKEHKSIAKFWHALGFTPGDLYLYKWLGE